MNNQALNSLKIFLNNNSILSLPKIEEAEKRAAKENSTMEEVLVKDGAIGSTDFNNIKAKVFGVTPISLTGLKISQDVLKILTPKVAQNYHMVVFQQNGKEISVGLVNPGDFQAHEAIDFLVQQNGLIAKYYAISMEDFRLAFRQYGGFEKEIDKAVEVAEKKFAEQNDLALAKGSGDFSETIKSAPVAKIVSVIIEHAIEGGASDIHIEPTHNGARVRYRVDGLLRTSLTLPDFLHQSVVSRIKVLADLKLDETRLPQDGRILSDINGQRVDLRVSILPTLDAEKVVIRVLDTSAGVPSLAELGFMPQHVEIIERNKNKPNGLFLLTGPTGSGKTTTLYSILNSLNSDDFNITTLEDPIEYYISGINQSQIRAEIGFTFAQGLRSILRQDPNIIMVGEIRDKETAQLVVHAALTGHLVFSTLHTNDAWGAVPRLVDMKAEPFLLSSTLNLILAQRLVRKICPKCKAEEKLPSNLAVRVEKELKLIPDAYLKSFKGGIKFYRGRGCADCAQSGYSGRSVVSEIIEITDNLRSLISRDARKEDVLEELKKQNFVSLAQDAIVKALVGVTSVEEVLRVTKIS